MNKFNIGDSVYHKDILCCISGAPYQKASGIVYWVSRAQTYSQWEAYEAELLSVTEWEAIQRGSQNNVGLAAFSRAWENTFGSTSVTRKEPTVSQPKCVCGAHKVKDSRHSTWCEIKN